MGGSAGRVAWLVWAAAGPAWAQPEPARGVDVDIELVRPVFSPDALPGIDVAEGWRGGSVRWGVVAQYSRAPLVLYAFDEEVGTVVGDRFTTFLGVSVDVVPAVTLRGVLPFFVQSGTDTPRFAADGVALGDASVGGHWAFLRGLLGGLGVAADLTLPTSTQDAYAGERKPRLLPMLLAHVDVGRVRLTTNAGAQVRFDVRDTQQDLVLGSELLWNTGVRVRAVTDRLDVGATVLTRWGLVRPGSAAESAGEVLATVAVRTTPWMWVDAGGGRGFTRGYGATDARAYVALRFEQARRTAPVEPPPAPVVPAPPREPDGGGITGTFAVPADPPPHIVYAGRELVLDEEIRFRVGSADLLPTSLPIVDRVADHLHGDARYGHVVIVGAASVEGEIDANYGLSLARADAVWRRLVAQGVPQERLSIRAVGEVQAQAVDGEARARDRWVRFLVAEELAEVELIGADPYPDPAVCPWSGEACPVVQPAWGE